MTQEQIEKLFNALSVDVYQLVDTLDFLNALRFERDFDRYPDGVATPQHGVYSYVHHFAMTTFFVVCGRLMDSDTRSYSLSYAMKKLRSYEPMREHLETIWAGKTKRWGEAVEIGDGQLLEEREWFRDQVDKCCADFILLVCDYGPIKTMRNKFYAHRNRAHHDEENKYSIKKEVVQKFVEDLKKLFNNISILFRHGSYAIDQDHGGLAARHLMQLTMNERIDLGLSILHRDAKITDGDIVDFCVNYYRRWDPWNHDVPRLALEAVVNRRKK